MVSALDSGSSGPSSSPGSSSSHCVVFLGKTLYSHSALFVHLYTQVYKWVPAGGNPAMD